MNRYIATIEFKHNFFSTLNIKNDLEFVLRNKSHNCYYNVNVKSIERISITPEEALEKIADVIGDSDTVPSDTIRSILDQTN